MPDGFERQNTTGFGKYLRNIKLKEDKTVYLYNGKKKTNQSAQYAVLDVSVGNKDLQQCADAVMRLRAEYLFSVGQEIVFYDNNHKEFRFKGPHTHENLLKYLDVVFANCNSASLEKMLKPKKMEDIEVGDVLIRGGFPGHVVIVMDVVTKGDRKAYMLAQSYMPAQDIHILLNRTDPWYYVGDKVINTPEYTFLSSELRSF